MKTKPLVAVNNHCLEQGIYDCCRSILDSFHSLDATDASFVYLLCNDGSLQIAQGKRRFLSSHFCEQAGSLGWRLCDLQIRIPDGYGPTSGIAVDKRTGLWLRSMLSPGLESIAHTVDKGRSPHRPPVADSNKLAFASNASIAVGKQTHSPQRNFSDTETDKYQEIYASAYKAALRWKFDPGEVAHYVLMKAIDKLEQIRVPRSFAWRTASRYCCSLACRAKSRPAHMSFEETARTYGPSYSEYLGSIMELKDPLASWLLCSKLFTDLSINEITQLTNHFSPQKYSASYYRMRMHAAIKSLDL